MAYEKVFEIVEKFAKERAAQDESLTMLHLLYGYAKLASFDQNMLGMFFGEDDKESISKVADLSGYFKDAKLDAKLIKDGIPILLLSNSSKEKEQQRCEEFLQKYSSDSDKVEHIIQDLLKMDLPEMILFTEGHKLQDVFAYVDKQKVDNGSSPKKPRHVDPTKDAPKQEEAKSADTAKGDRVSGDSDTGRAEAKEEADKSKETKKTDPKESGDSASEGKNEEAERDDFKILIKKTKQLYSDLLEKVKGQDDAVRMFVQGYFQAEVLRGDDPEQKKPAATFLFAGPPGVGKTLLASNTAEMLGLPFKRFDMSEFTNPSSVDTFIGTESSYKGDKGQVTQFAKENPRSIILFDEIEKAHTKIIYLFLQMLDGGVLTDARTNEQISFKDTIIIFTTNIGKKLYEGMRGTNLSSTPAAVILDALQTEKNPATGEPAFPGAICSRLASGNIIMFNHLGIHTLLDIVEGEFNKSINLLKKRYGFEIELDPLLAPLFLFNQSGDVDARIATGKSGLLIKNELYEFGRHIKNTEEVFDNLKKIQFVVEIPDDDADIRSLFINEECVDILVVTDKNISTSDYEGTKFRIQTASNVDEVMNIVKTKDIAFVIIDVLYSVYDSDRKFLSQDDISSLGLDCFAELCEKVSDMPVYLVENQEMDLEDKATFLRMGARGFLKETEEGSISSKDILELVESVHLQERADNLVRRGRVVNYNTAQYLSDDNTLAIIRFYDFKLRQAVSGDTQKLMLSEVSKPTDRFDDVIGAEDAKSDLKFFVNFMQNPRKFILEGHKAPKGILLYGPPGTGKTMLARAMAGECNVSFFPTTANNFFSKWVGETEENIRNLFASAKRYAPSIIFIDEIDAIGKERTGDSSAHHTEKALNQLLTEMDGFEVDPKRPVFVIAATNFDLDGSKSGKSSSMDPALMRRFDNRIYVDLPKEKERKQYIEMILRKKNLQGKISEGTINNLAERTTGMSLAILQNILELGFRNAAKKGEPVNDEIMLNAFEEYQYGEKREWNEDYYRSVAVHESGHAYLNWISGDAPSFVTIVSRGDFGGYMMPGNGEKTPNYTKEQLLGKIRTSLAGRAAEIVFYGEESGVNTGASSDLEHATHYAMNMVCRYGMTGGSLISLTPETILKSSMADDFIQKVNRLLEEEMANTIKIVEEGKAYIENLSGQLVKENQLVGERIVEIFENTKKQLGQ